MLQNKSLVAKNRRRSSWEWASERSKTRHSLNDPDGDACVRSCWFVRFFPSKHCRIAYRVTNFSALAARVLSLGWGCGSGDLRGAPHRRFSPTFRWTRRELGNNSWENSPVLGFIEIDFSNQIVIASGFLKYSSSVLFCTAPNSNDQPDVIKPCLPFYRMYPHFCKCSAEFVNMFTDVATFSRHVSSRESQTVEIYSDFRINDSWISPWLFKLLPRLPRPESTDIVVSGYDYVLISDLNKRVYFSSKCLCCRRKFVWRTNVFRQKVKHFR